jgi:hypothetical protein
MIIQLTAAQRSILEPACGRQDRCVFPVTAPLKGGAVGNVLKSLLKRGQVEEVPRPTSTPSGGTPDGAPLTLRATEAACLTLAGESTETPHRAPQSPPAEVPALQPKTSRQDTLLQLLRRKEGATISDMSEATGWQAHSVRGALSGVVGKKLGLKVVSEKVLDRGRVYRIG